MDNILTFAWSKRQQKSIYRNAGLGILSCRTEAITGEWAQGGCMAFWRSVFDVGLEGWQAENMHRALW